MTIIYITAEVSPFSKVGGLADVSDALPAELARLGEQLIVITPLYSIIDCQKYGVYPTGIQNQVMVGNTSYVYHIYESHHNDNPNHRIWFIENDYFFNRKGIYTDESGSGFEDNNERFFFFQFVIIDLLKRNIVHPQLIHCHDHHTAMIPMLIKNMDYPASVLFTIHNFDYRGHFSSNEISLLPSTIAKKVRKYDPSIRSSTTIGLEYSDWINTVSPTYAKELLTHRDLSHELYDMMNSVHQKFNGIVNGMDDVYWNPFSDPHLTDHYSLEDLSGKAKNKLILQEKCGLTLDPKIPLIGSIGRLVESKGYSLILSSLEVLVKQGAQFVFLGSGSPEIAMKLGQFSKKYPHQISYTGEFNEKLAHLIEAGSDIFMMPSQFEPCGLNQIYSLKYGTIPVVHKTGGLADTVVDWDGKYGTGFVFDSYSSKAFQDSMNRALDLYLQKDIWYKIQMNAMSRDFSWHKSAKAYQKLYHKLSGASYNVRS